MMKRENYQKLLSTLFAVADANSGTTSEAILIYSEDILRKFAFHAISALRIYDNRDYDIPNYARISLCDFSSINVISRALIESYLIFYWIFIDNKSNETVKLRYLIWKLTSLHWVANLDLEIEEAKKIQQQSTERMRELKSELTKNKAFLYLNDKEQKKCLQKIKDGRELYSRPSWGELMQQSGIPKKFCKTYSYFCSFSHTGFTSVNQLRTANSIEEQTSLSKLALQFNMIFLGKFIYQYCELFPKAKTYLQSDEKASSIVNFFAKLGKIGDKEPTLNIADTSLSDFNSTF